jgi:secreted Zn-dependent insulinase-like peptidase
MDEAIKRTQKHLKEFVEKEINKIKYNTLKDLIDKIKVLPEKEMDMDKIKKLANKVVSQMNND